MPKKPTPGSITQTADVQKDRINNISNVSSAISRMQKDVDQKISETRRDVKDNAAISQVHEAMGQTLSGLNRTIGALTSGIAKITADTARATAEAVRQYGQAISQDISFNKKSVVSMALAQTSPLYGYFVAKFMETDVFKRALTKMKLAVSQTIGAIVRPLRGRAGARGGEDIPHMQTGGKVQQGGMARLHAGETVIPKGMDLTGVGNTLEEMLQVQKRQALYMRSVFGVWAEIGLGKRMLKKILTPFTIPFRFIKMFRRTKGAYVSHLSKSGQPLENMAQNVATLYMGLMWRLDNMLNVMVANAEATRDLSAYVTKTKYKPIKSVPNRVPAFSMIRTLTKMAFRPATLPLEFLTEGLFGKTGLTKKRGLYKNQPGFFEGLWDKMRPEGRREMLGQRGRRGKILRGGEEAGPGVLGEGSTVANVSALGFAKELARIQGDVWGGKRGFHHPIWTIRKFGREDSFRHMEQQEELQKIRESNEAQQSMQEKSRKEAKKKGIFGWIKTIFGFFGSFFKIAAMGGIVAIIGGLIGTWLKNYLDKNYNFSQKIQDFFNFNEITAKGINDLVAAQSDRAFKAMKDLKTGDITPEMAHAQVEMSKRFRGVKQSSGALSQRGSVYAQEIQAGMQSYMQQHMASYLMYDSQEIVNERNSWLQSKESGNWLSKQWEKVKSIANANAVGVELEKRFHIHMQNKLSSSDQQRAAPKSYHEIYETGIKEKKLSAADEAKLRKTQIEAEKRQKSAFGITDPARAKDVRNLSEVRATVKDRFIDTVSSLMAEDRGGDKMSYRGRAGAIYDQIVELAGGNSPILSDYSKLSKLGIDTYREQQRAVGYWTGSYDPMKVESYVKGKIKEYSKGLPTNINVMDPASRHMMEAGGGSISGAAIAANEAQIVAKEMYINSTPMVEAMKDVGDKVTDTQKNVGKLTILNQNQNTAQAISNMTNAQSIGGGGGANSIPDHTVTLNLQGIL